MFIAIVKINIKAMKLDEITVTFQPSNPSRPVIITTAKKQLLKIEKDKFLKGDWPAVLKKAEQLDIDLVELVNKG